MTLEDAYAHLRAGRAQEAEEALRRVVALHSGHAEALELLGIVLAQQGRAYEALSWFERAIAARPDSPGPRHNRAQALFALGHLVVLQPWRLATFFPGLLFGWLRERTGDVAASVLVHALSNLFIAILEASFYG